MEIRFKIIIGYSILIALFAFIVYLFRVEQIKRSTLQKDEWELAHTQKLMERIYRPFWELTTQTELVSVWKRQT